MSVTVAMSKELPWADLTKPILCVTENITHQARYEAMCRAHLPESIKRNVRIILHEDGRITLVGVDNKNGSE